MLGMTTTMDTVTTGIKDITETLGGGIHEGSLVLIEGEAKAGKSVLSQHIAYGVLCSKDCSIAYYTTDKTTEELMAQMDSLSLHVRHDLVTDRLRVYTINSNNILKDPQKSHQLLINHILELPKHFKLVIVDSLTPFMTHISPVSKMDFLYFFKELCGQDRAVVLVVDNYAFEGKTLSRAYLLSDYYLKLRSKDMMLESGQVDTRVIKILEVTKIAGVERQAQDGIKFEIKPKVGIQILPFVTIKV